MLGGLSDGTSVLGSGTQQVLMGAEGSQYTKLVCPEMPLPSQAPSVAPKFSRRHSKITAWCPLFTTSVPLPPQTYLHTLSCPSRPAASLSCPWTQTHCTFTSP
jgi:hypothetical protein